MNKILLLLFSACLLLVSATAGATALSSYTFDSKEDEQAFREFSAELRCLVCQNQSLADSDADLADDLRREVYTMWRAGKSKEEIVTFLVDRYGDFVLYNPPLKPSTYILWFSPLFVMLIAGFFLLRTLLRKNRAVEQSLTEEEQQRINELLKTDSDPQDNNP
jgi:cytochrome c-type biogenesis protein CcmH